MSKYINKEFEECIKNNSIVIFIGSGLSKRCGIPLWSEMIEKILKSPEIEKGDDFLNALKSGIMTPIEILDKIKNKHKKIIYRIFQEETSVNKEDEIYKKIKLISKKIITTNYDNLIEINTGIKSIESFSKFSLSTIDSSEEYILKIHGSHINIDNCVIFTEDFENLYQQSGNLAKFQLEKIISSNTCIFIGFSLNDYFVAKLFEHLDTMYNSLGPKHYLISKEASKYDFLNIVSISNHEEIDIVVDEILLHCAEKNIDSKVSKETTNNDISKEKIPSSFNYGNDTAPRIDDWTGRSAELRALSMDHRACFITGIGGQGKSALASKFLSLTDSSIYSFRDWRDFKEEDLNFQYKLFGLIELVSHKAEKIDSLIGLETNELIDIFFRHLGDQKGVFVFDNIDKYIDLEKFVPAGDMMTFFDKIMRLPHNSKFIFTCRPFIQYAGVGSYQIKLEGLFLEDTRFLLKKYHEKLNELLLSQYSKRLHQATRGHPLWISLSIAQSRDNSQQLETIIQKIENRNISDTDINYSSVVSRTVLENLWSNLKDREKIILRALSVSAITESEEALANVLKSELNYNQFSKSMRSLKFLNLVISKENFGYIELHPLVREFIVSNYGKDEQEGYIALYVKYLNGFILLLKEKLGKNMNPEDIEIIIKKIEITNSSHDFQESINELRRSWGSIIISGYSEEALRVSDALLSKLTWSKSKLSDLIGFFEFMDIFFERCSEFGRADLFEKYITKYNSVYQTPDMSMILSKSSSCRNAWLNGNYELAIKEGKSASDLIDLLQEDEIWAGKCHYNLALRDSKIESNILISLEFFLKNLSIEEIIERETKDANPTQAGNAARCLIYLNDIENGKKLLCKAYRDLKRTHTNSYTSKQNLGYASEWISEYFYSVRNNKGYLYFLINSKNLWEKNLQGKYNRINQIISKLPASEENSSILSLESWQISKYCDEMVDRNLS